MLLRHSSMGEGHLLARQVVWCAGTRHPQLPPPSPLPPNLLASRDLSGRGASLLLPVPGGESGPSGVLVCGENWVAYKHQDHPEVRAPLPRRREMPPERGLLITSGILHQQPGLFFHLLQSELGDLYKVGACFPLVLEWGLISSWW